MPKSYKSLILDFVGAILEYSDKIKAAALNFEGEWIGEYPGVAQVVSIKQDGSYISARKITEDQYIPVGELTFVADLKSGVGSGQICRKEYREPRWVPGRLLVLNPNLIQFRWYGIGAVEFRRDDI